MKKPNQLPKEIVNLLLPRLQDEFNAMVPEDTDLTEQEQKEIGKAIATVYYKKVNQQLVDLKNKIGIKSGAESEILPDRTKQIREIEDKYSILIKQELDNGKSNRTLSEGETQPERDTEIIISAAGVVINEARKARTEKEVDASLDQIEDALNEIESKVGKLTESWSDEDIQHEYPNKIIGKQSKKEITKYAKEIARINGWEVPKEKNAIYDNIAPAGGSVVFHLNIPGTPYQMYVAAEYSPEWVNDRGGYENYNFKGMFYRLEEPTAKGQSKYKGANQWQRQNITAKEMAEILRTEANKYIKPSITEIAKESKGQIIIGKVQPFFKESGTEKPTTKDKLKQVRKDIDDAFDDFTKGGNLMTTGGIDPVKIEKGVKLIGLYMKAGVYKFQDIIEDLNERYGDKVKAFFEELKGVYSYYYNTNSSEEEANKMDSNLRGKTFDNILNDIKNGRGTTNDVIAPVGEGLTGVDANRTSANVQGADGQQNVGRVDGEQGERGNENAGQTGEQRNTTEPSEGISEGNADVALNGNEQLNEELGGESQEQPIPEPAEQKSVVSQLQHNQNFVIPPDFVNGKNFNVAQKLQDNIDAIRVLISLKNEKRRATYEEQKTLFKYVGWGGIKEIGFNPASNSGWTSSNIGLRAKIQEALDVLKELDEENFKANLDAVKRSTQNAHYTAIPIIRGIYNVLRYAGFKGGNILEASAGIGNFIGAMPAEISGNSKITAIELENITGQILKGLYPNISTKISGYQDVAIPAGTVDLSISNIPFGKVSVTDVNFEKGKDPILKASQKAVHSYFFARAIQDATPGTGIIAFVTTTGILDSQSNQGIRDMMADRTEFLGAIRLPNDSFRGNANTQVTTDIIFLRKFAEGEEKKQQHEFQVIKSTQLKHKDKDQMFNVSYNEYFHNNPEMVLGETAAFSMYGSSENSDDITVVPTGINLEEGISNLADKIFKNKITETEQKEKDEEVKENIQQFIQKNGQRPGNIIEISPGEFGLYSDELAINPELDAKAREVGINPDKIREYDLLPDEVEWLKSQTGLTYNDFQINKVVPVKIAKKYQNIASYGWGDIAEADEFDINDGDIVQEAYAEGV